MSEAMSLCRPANKQRGLIEAPTMMATPPANCARTASEIKCEEFYFVDLIFVVCESTVKTTKIGSLENFRLYGTTRTVGPVVCRPSGCK